MNGKARNFFIGMLLLLLGISTAACGKEEYVVEYGVDGYVYLPQQLYSVGNVNELNVFTDFLYLTRDGGDRIFVERLPISSMLSDDGGLNFSKKKRFSQCRMRLLCCRRVPRKYWKIMIFRT